MKTLADGILLKSRTKWFTYLGIFYSCLSLIFLVGISVFFKVFKIEDINWQNKVLTKVLNILKIETIYSTEHYLGVFSGEALAFKNLFSVTNYEVLLPVAMFILAFYVTYKFLIKKISYQNFSKLIVLLSIVNFMAVFIFIYDAYPSKKIYENKPELAVYLNFAEKNPLNYRLLGFLTGEGAFRRGLIDVREDTDNIHRIANEMLSLNLHMLYKIPRIDGYEPLQTLRTHRLWHEIVAPEILESSVPKDSDPIEYKKEKFLTLLPLLSTYNTKYILSGFELEHDGLLLVKETNKEDYKLYLYQNKNALPRVYIPKNIKITQEWNDQYFNEINENLAIVECSKCNSTQNTGEISNLNYKTGMISFDVESSSNVWVVLSESNVPGWVAKIDDKPASIRKANYILQAVNVPAGHHKVDFQYIGFKKAELAKLGF